MAPLLAVFLLMAPASDRPANAVFSADVRRLCQSYLDGFFCPATNVAYHHRINGPRGLAALADPAEIAAGMVGGKPMPFGYGSGIQDVALENGQLLWALCEACQSGADPWFAETARKIFAGLKGVATLSPEPGFVPRGPHPDGKSYYRNSSRDQHCGLVEGLWRYARSPLSTAEDRALVAKKLGAIARRMERYGWQITVEDGSRQAHVGFAWTQRTSIGSLTLLSCLGMVSDVTGDPHWDQLYRQFSEEDGASRWRKWLQPDVVERWSRLTLYSDQFAQSLAALERTERDPARKAQVRELLRRLSQGALRGNVFDPKVWRRLDWAGSESDEAARPLAELAGLSLDHPATVMDLYRACKPELLGSSNARLAAVHGKLCFGLATCAFHKALLSGDHDLVAEVAPAVRRMVAQMLRHGDHYQRGENFNRTVVLGLLLVGNSINAETQRRQEKTK